MAYIEWKPELDVLVESMNNEHKRWIGYINTLYESNKAKRSPSEILHAYDNMSDYTREHFGHEEEYLQRIDYPMFDVHKQEHTVFLEKIRDEKSKFNGTEFHTDFFDFLGDWLLRHIKIVDIRYGEYTQRMKKAG